MPDGFIYLWRKILDTSFYTNPNACHLAIHLLLKANWKERKIVFNNKEISIGRGEHLSGRLELSRETGLTEREIRTSLTILKNVGFLTSTSTNAFSVFHICKYDDYQIKASSTSTSQRPASDQPVTTPNKGYKDIRVEITHTMCDFDKFWSAYPNKKAKRAAVEPEPEIEPVVEPITKPNSCVCPQ